jgi:hypothetical protein
MESVAAKDAGEWLKYMVAVRLGPGLRELGFTGNGPTFRRGLGQACAHVDLVSETAADHRSVRFTLDVGVSRRDEWTESLRVRPYYLRRQAPGAGRQWTWHDRIGRLVRVGGLSVGELWWDLAAGQSFDSIAGDVVTMVREFALPAIADRR